jgi:hypothetical protein
VASDDIVDVLHRAEKLGLLVRPPQRLALTRDELRRLGKPLSGAGPDVVRALADDRD